MPDNVFLGFDGGGTKTEAVLLDAAGNELARALSGPSNPVRVGFDAAFESLTFASRETLRIAGAAPENVRAVCAGLAGAGRPAVIKLVEPFLQKMFPQALVHVTADFTVALEAAAGDGPGVVLIAGTGSCAFGRNSDGRFARAGGYGPWVGDEGSAYDIGRQAVSAVLHARDALAPSTLLEEQLLPALELSDWGELVERIAKNPDAVFPNLFPLVVRASDEGDEVARKILNTAAGALGRIAGSVIISLGLRKEKFPLAKSGGVFGHSAHLEAKLGALLANFAPAATLFDLRDSPALGAARLALRLSAT